MTRKDVVAKYGVIDFASKRWPDRDKHMGMVEIPHDWFPGWVVGGTKIPVHHIYCNKDTHKPLMQALQSVHALGLGGQLKTFDGCFNIRAVRGSSAFSLHSYGLAFDFSAKWNPLQWVKAPWKLKTTFTPEFVRCFKEQGFFWGGDWAGRKDPMHLVWGCNG